MYASLVFANSGRLGERGSAAAGLSTASRRAAGQVITARELGRHGRFLADPRGQREVGGKRAAGEEAAQATRRGLGMAIPEAGRDGGSRRRGIAEAGTGQQREFGEALTGLGILDELALGTDPLFRGQRELFHRLPIAVEAAGDGGIERERGGQQERLRIVRVVDR